MRRLGHSSIIVVVALTIATAAACGCTAAYGLLPELVPWPPLTWAVPVTLLEVSASPSELGPSGHEALYGTIPVGRGPGSGVLFSIRPGAPPLMRFDTDGDGDLSDEAESYPTLPIDARSVTWSVTVLARYSTGPETLIAPYPLRLTALYDYATGQYVYGYSGFSHRRGAIDIDGRLTSIAVATLRSDGAYDDPSALVVVIDADRDGLLDDRPGSHEVFAPGEAIQVGERRFVMGSMSPDGLRISLIETEPAAIRPVIGRGAAAPPFVTTTVDGRLLALDDMRGDVAILLFVDGVRCIDCPPAMAPSDGESAAWERLRDICLLLEIGAAEAAQVVVVMDGGDVPVDAPRGPTIHYVVDDAVQRLYRRTLGAIVVGTEGIIEALDEAWVLDYGGGHRYGHLDELHAVEIVAIAARANARPES